MPAPKQEIGNTKPSVYIRARTAFSINSDLTAEPLNQNLSPENRDPSPEVLKSAQDNDKKPRFISVFTKSHRL